MSFMKFARALATLLATTFAGTAIAADVTPGEAWDATVKTRQLFLETTVGPLPHDIMKMLNMTGVWPGGGLYVIPARRLGPNLAVYTTFGLTNPDMPTTVQMTGFRLDADGQRASAAAGTLQRKTPAPKPPGASGYGYELFVVAAPGQGWPLNLLQWAVNAEIIHDVGLLARVDKYDGLTVERVGVGPGLSVNVLIARARPPLPTGTNLVEGRMDVLVATTITDDEMQWSMKNGRAALLDKLRDAGVGQVSVLERDSVVQ